MSKESLVDEDGIRRRFAETQQANECKMHKERGCYFAFRLGGSPESLSKTCECYKTIYEEFKSTKSQKEEKHAGIHL